MSAAYFVPVEIIDRCLSPSGMATVIKLTLAGAQRQPLAMVRVLRGAWVARFDFIEPVVTRNGSQNGLQLVLTVHPEQQ